MNKNMHHGWPHMTREENDIKIKHHNLPSHVTKMLYDDYTNKPKMELLVEPVGIYLPKLLFDVKDRKPTTTKWWTEYAQRDDVTVQETKGQHMKTLDSADKLGRSTRPKKSKYEIPDVQTYVKIGPSLTTILKENQFGKLAFVGLGCSDDLLPSWVKDRLKSASASVRFELPFDKRMLEGMTPLQYLTRFVRMYRDQRLRYTQVFNRFTPKHSYTMKYEKLFPALDFMFSACLGKTNFTTLQVLLFAKEPETVSLDAFIGISAFADRLFWTFYLQKNSERDTGSHWLENRSSLEFADMENLSRKLDGFHLSDELKTLLLSLG